MSTLLEESATFGESVGWVEYVDVVETLGWNGWVVAVEGYLVQ